MDTAHNSARRVCVVVDHTEPNDSVMRDLPLGVSEYERNLDCQGKLTQIADAPETSCHYLE